jgi:hypothetical protein
MCHTKSTSLKRASRCLLDLSAVVLCLEAEVSKATASKCLATTRWTVSRPQPQSTTKWFGRKERRRCDRTASRCRTPRRCSTTLASWWFTSGRSSWRRDWAPHWVQDGRFQQPSRCRTAAGSGKLTYDYQSVLDKCIGDLSQSELFLYRYLRLPSTCHMCHNT